MAKIVAISGSPSNPSSTDALLAHTVCFLQSHGHEVEVLRVRHLPANALVSSDCKDPLIDQAVRMVADADAVVLATPVFKASYSGLFKLFIDLLPMDAFVGKPVLPLVTGGSHAHVLVLDYSLKPLAVTLGATHVADGRFVLSGHIDKYVDPAAGGATITDPEVAAALARTVTDFEAEIALRVPAAVSVRR